MENQKQIYYINADRLNNDFILENYIYPDLNQNYYWSDDFSPSFYIDLADKGFITISTKEYGEFLLLPEIQFEYAVLHFEDLYIPKKVRKLLNKDNYIFSINKYFDKSLSLISKYHTDSWVNEEYIQILNKLRAYKHPSINFELFSFEVCDKDTKELVASEIGYTIGKTYTSLTGYFNREKKYNNYGKLQLVLLAKYLESKNYAFWNLGHPYMDYKFALGAKVYNREEFLEMWNKYKIKDINE